MGCPGRIAATPSKGRATTVLDLIDAASGRIELPLRVTPQLTPEEWVPKALHPSTLAVLLSQESRFGSLRENSRFNVR